jgi:adenosylcobinamide-phosphate synthase
MIIYHMSALVIGYLLDLLIGDPPKWPHPVRWMGGWIAFLERRWNKGNSRKIKGVFMLLAVLVPVITITGLSVALFYWIHPLAGIFWEGLLISTTIAQKSLKDAALAVYQPLQAGKLKDGREKLAYIVGRDTEELPESEIVRGTVETVAENTSDGVTAPLFWGLFGGAVFAVAYRAINTCDSMVGYKNERYQDFGWASAKMDDVVNWIPSRITCFLMIICFKPEFGSRRKCWSILLRDAPKHPSPNSGWCEAAVAALLSVQLGGINFYKGLISNRAKMGDSLVQLKSIHILKTITIMQRSSFLFLLLLLLGGLAVELAITWF